MNNNRIVSRVSGMKNLSLNDIDIGMRVFKEQLSSIYDTWIILYKPKSIIYEKMVS